MRVSTAAPFRRRSRALPRLVATLCFAATAYFATAEPAAADPNGMLELAVEATYLYKLPPFITWTSGGLASPTSPFTLCVVGDDPFGELLDRAVVGKKIGERPIAVLRLRTAAHDSPCQMMYIGPGAEPIAATLRAVDGAPVLTVTDNAADNGTKGIVNFVVRDNHLRFEIDQAAAQRNRLEISSKLLSVALSVTPK